MATARTSVLPFLLSSVHSYSIRSLAKIDEILAAADRRLQTLLPYTSCKLQVLGSDSEVGVEVGGEEDNPGGPCAASLSKARYKLDLMLMVNRREFWKRHPYRDHFISLGFFAASYCRLKWIV